jgi:Fe-S-cluster containining protein
VNNKIDVSSCHSCGSCCRLFLINLNEAELNSGKFLTEFEGHGQFDDFASIEEFGLNILKKNEDESCIYLIDNKCSVYDNRPEVCRDFSCGSDRKEFGEMIEEINENRQ